MPRDREVRRVTWHVRRCSYGEGWRPLVLIGEQPVPMRVEPTKAEARRAARAMSAKLKEAGQ